MKPSSMNGRDVEQIYQEEVLLTNWVTCRHWRSPAVEMGETERTATAAMVFTSPMLKKTQIKSQQELVERYVNSSVVKCFSAASPEGV